MLTSVFTDRIQHSLDNNIKIKVMTAKNKRKLKNKQFGIVYIDKYGRQSQVFSSDSATKFIDKSKKN